MPFIPCALSWHDINYNVDDPGKKGDKLGLRLLNGISGYAKPNTMTALMGSSGAGKTTLLDVLAGRKNTGKIEGDILLNGQTADPITFSRFSGYVEQMDIHSPSMTVHEALLFSGHLRLPKSVPDKDKDQFVLKVLHMLRLTPIKDCLIGTKDDGLSVEQVPPAHPFTLTQGKDPPLPPPPNPPFRCLADKHGQCVSRLRRVGHEVHII